MIVEQPILALVILLTLMGIYLAGREYVALRRVRISTTGDDQATSSGLGMKESGTLWTALTGEWRPAAIAWRYGFAISLAVGIVGFLIAASGYGRPRPTRVVATEGELVQVYVGEGGEGTVPATTWETNVDDTLHELALLQLEQGHGKSAVEIALRIRNTTSRVSALRGIFRGIATGGGKDKLASAEETAEKAIRDPLMKAVALLEIARAAAKSNPAEAIALLQKAEQRVKESRPPFEEWLHNSWLVRSVLWLVVVPVIGTLTIVFLIAFIAHIAEAHGQRDFEKLKEKGSPEPDLFPTTTPNK